MLFSDIERISPEVARFLRRSDMLPEEDLAELTLKTALVMKESLKEERTGPFPMIRSYVYPGAEVCCEKPVLAIDIGGSSTRFAPARWDDEGKISLGPVKTVPTPGKLFSVTQDRFFDMIAEEMAQYGCERAGVSFSFIGRASKDTDVLIDSFSKELTVTEVRHEYVGREINRALKKLGKPEMSVAVTNDSCAAFMGCRSGNGALPDVSFILGTGYNNCCCVPSLGGMLINTESGYYGGLHFGTIDREADLKSANRGEYLAEKTVSGAYIGPVIYAACLTAAGEGLFTEPCAKAVKERPLPYSTAEINEYMEGEGPLISEFSNAVDRNIFTGICSFFVQRAAENAAAMTAACALLSEPDKERPVIIAAEGSTYLKFPLLRSIFDKTLKKLIKATLGLETEIISSENAVLKGAALAGAMKK